MKKKLLISIFIFSFWGLKSQTFNSLLSKMLQDTLNTYVSQIPSIKGMSASVYVPGQGIWNGVKGNSYPGKSITSDMRFGIASNSKLFTSVMILKLAENNILSLNDSLKDWLTISNSNINPNITIRQLLNHSSGISDPFFASPWFDTINLNPTRVFTPNEVLKWVGTPLFKAGTSYGYSNTNYVLAGMVAEKASSYPLSILIRDSILNLIKMDSTFIDVEEPVNGIIAHRYWNNINYHDTSRVGLNSAVGYAGSIFSTASELVQWYNALFNGELISKTSINELITFIPTSNPNYQYGLGLSRDITQGYRYWGHGGRTWGYKSKMIYDSCLNVSVAGLTNSDPSGVDAVTFLLYRVVKNHIPGCLGSINGINEICHGKDSVTYSISPISNADSYEWTLPSGVSGKSNSNTISVKFGQSTNSGKITVRGINKYGPGGFSTLWVNVKPKPKTPLISINGNTLKSNAPNGNQWYNSKGIIIGATDSIYTMTSNDHYYCIVTLMGCSSDSSNNITTKNTNVNDPYFDTQISLFPNPSSSEITLTSTAFLNNVNLLLIDNCGKIVLNIKNLSGNSFVLKELDLENGFYLVKLIGENHLISSKKIIIAN
jgi:CubicO group peptidase (beta-lactamase class C family)